MKSKAYCKKTLSVLFYCESQATILCKKFINIKLLSIQLIYIVFFTSCRTLDRIGESFTDTLNARIDLVDIHPPKKQKGSELNKVFKQFIADARRRGVKITDKSIGSLRIIKYVDEFTSEAGKSVIGTCNRFYSQAKKMSAAEGFINYEYFWETLEIHKERTLNFTGGHPLKLKELLYHEFFHCLLKKGHLPKGYQGIMSPILYSYKSYCKNNKVYECRKKFHRTQKLATNCKDSLMATCFKAMRVMGYENIDDEDNWDILVNELFSKENRDLIPDVE